MKKLTVLVAVIAVFAVGCSSSDNAAETTTTHVETTTSEASADETTTTAAETTTTVAGTTTTAPAVETEPVIPGDPDHDQIVELFTVAFDGETTFEEKAPFIDDPDGLEGVVHQYESAAASVGGLALGVTHLGVADDEALVIYDLFFGESPFQIDQEGEAVRGAERWQVTRSYFCSIMALARVNCPVGG